MILEAIVTGLRFKPFPGMFKYDIGSMLGTSPSAPPPRNLGNEFNQTANALINSAPAFYNLAAEYTLPYNELNLAAQYQNLTGFTVPSAPTGTVPGMGAAPQDFSNEFLTGEIGPGSLISAQGAKGKGKNKNPAKNAVAPPLLASPNIGTGLAPGTNVPGLLGMTSLQRASDIQDLQNLGPQATLALLNADPYLAGSLNDLYNRLGNSPILDELNNEAMSALQSGGQLSPEQARAADQASRATFAARGLSMSDPAIAGEILNRDNAVQARLAAARQFATGVEGLNENQTGIVGNAARTFATTIGDPAMTILGRPSQSTAIPQTTAQPNFSPTNAYSQDLFNTNYNANAAANIAGANNNAALWGALIGSIGKVAGAAAMSDRREKKYIKRIGKSPSGLGIYKFQYKGKHKTPTYIGPMAQDVERKKPGAVTENKTGVKFVKLDKIDVPFHEIGKLLAA